MDRFCFFADIFNRKDFLMGRTAVLSVSTPETIFSVVYCIGMIAAFVIGAAELRKKKAPLYLRLMIYAIGCAALEAICTTVAIVCSNENDPSRTARLFSSIAYYIFLASANWGQIDGLVDERTPKTKKARLIALIFPAVVAVAAPFILIPLFSSKKIAFAIVLMIELIPLAIGGYFSFKHLLLPMDAVGIKKMAKPINISVIISMVLGLLYMASYIYVFKGKPLFSDIVRAAIMINTFFMMNSTVRGHRVWKTLV